MQQILIGTNSLDTLYDIHVEGDVEPNPTYSGYRAVLKILSCQAQAKVCRDLGRVTLGSDSAETVPAGGTAVVDGRDYRLACFPFIENVCLSSGVLNCPTYQLV